MADVPSNIDPMNTLEVAFESPLSATLLNKISANINALIDQGPFQNFQEFLTGGTFNVPEAVEQVLLVGCGGGQGASAGNTTTTGTTVGADTTFGALATFKGASFDGASVANGGYGGDGAALTPLNGRTGVEFVGGAAGAGGTPIHSGGGGGAGPFGNGAAGGVALAGAGSNATANSGAGGGGGAGTAVAVGGGYGGAGSALVQKLVSVTPLDAITVTIGGGGAGQVTGGGTGNGGNGGSGRLIVYW